MTAYKPEMPIFVDETGTDKQSSLRKYGYALKGQQTIAEKVLVRGKRHSVISVMGIDGILITRQSVAKWRFVLRVCKA